MQGQGVGRECRLEGNEVRGTRAQAGNQNLPGCGINKKGEKCNWEAGKLLYDCCSCSKLSTSVTGWDKAPQRQIVCEPSVTEGRMDLGLLGLVVGGG